MFQLNHAQHRLLSRIKQHRDNCKEKTSNLTNQGGSIFDADGGSNLDAGLQAREISRIAVASDFPFDSKLIQHISPIEWKNVILYSEIKIDPAKLRMHSA